MPPPASFKGRRRLVMNPIDVPQGVLGRAVGSSQRRAGYRATRGDNGAIFPMSVLAGDACGYGAPGIPSLYYGPRGGFLDQGPDGAYMFISEMVVYRQGPRRSPRWRPARSAATSPYLQRAPDLAETTTCPRGTLRRFSVES